MANTQIYITNEVKEKLDRLATLEKRPLIDEMDYLVTEQLKRLAQIEAKAGCCGAELASNAKQGPEVPIV